MDKIALDGLSAAYDLLWQERRERRSHRRMLRNMLGSWEWDHLISCLRWIARNFDPDESESGTYDLWVCVAQDPRDGSYLIFTTDTWEEHGRYPTLSLAVKWARMYAGETTDDLSYDEWRGLTEEGLE